MKKLNVAFIDDDAVFEIPLFIETFDKYFNIFSASSFDGFISLVEKNNDPAIDLFVLDLYFPDSQRELDRKKIEALKKKPLELKPDMASPRGAYQNCGIVEKRYQDILSVCNQTPQGGLDLMYRIHERFGDVPVVFYSRKATVKDALVCLKAGAREVIKKPSGGSDGETRRITKQLGDLLKEKMLKAILKEKHDLTEHVDLILSSLDLF